MAGAAGAADTGASVADAGGGGSNPFWQVTNLYARKNKQGIVAVTVHAPEIVRVRCSPTPAFGRDHSYAIVNRNLGAPNATFDVGSQQAVIATSALRVTLRYRPFRVSVADAAGNDLQV